MSFSEDLPINLLYPLGNDAIMMICGCEYKCEDEDPITKEMKFSPTLQKEMYNIMESLYINYNQKLNKYGAWHKEKYKNDH